MNRPAILAIGVAIWMGGLRGADAADPSFDQWLADTDARPPELASCVVASNQFAKLRAEVIGGRLRMALPNEDFATNARVLLHVSIDDPGHWPARDWETIPMIRTERQYEAAVRVTEPSVPIVYFASQEEPAATGTTASSNAVISPLRFCRPTAAGMASPSHLFWPYLDGFEESLLGWRLLTPGVPPLEKDPAARTGKSALRVLLPAGRDVVSIATTRARGWHASLRGALGMRLWLRTKSGQVRARFTLLADAQTPRQQVAVFPTQDAIGPHWQKVDLWFSEMPGFNLPRLDLLTIDFIGQGPVELLLDDVQLLGRWKAEP